VTTAARPRRRIGTSPCVAALLLLLLLLLTAASAPVVAAPPDTAPPGSSPPVPEPSEPARPEPTSPPETSAVGNAPPDDGTESSGGDQPAIGWWIGGLLVTVAAVSGILYSLRRRNDTEEWALQASVACDIGRATSFTLISQLEAPVWSRPDRFVEQQQRFSDHLAELRGSVPGHDVEALLVEVTAANDRLRTAVEELPADAPIASARSILQPALDDLAVALDALEREASVTVFGATLPSSRSTA